MRNPSWLSYHFVSYFKSVAERCASPLGISCMSYCNAYQAVCQFIHMLVFWVGGYCFGAFVLPELTHYREALALQFLQPLSDRMCG